MVVGLFGFELKGYAWKLADYRCHPDEPWIVHILSTPTTVSLLVVPSAPISRSLGVMCKITRKKPSKSVAYRER